MYFEREFGERVAVPNGDGELQKILHSLGAKAYSQKSINAFKELHWFKGDVLSVWHSNDLRLYSRMLVPSAVLDLALKIMRFSPDCLFLIERNIDPSVDRAFFLVQRSDEKYYLAVWDEIDSMKIGYKLVL